MNLLLDTHALLWWLGGNPTLSNAASSEIADSESLVFVSAASIWEIAIKENLGRLTLTTDIGHQLEPNSLLPLSITIEHVRLTGSLPRHHDDPFDRMLVAQALAEGLTIVTRDRRLARYGVPTLPA